MNTLNQHMKKYNEYLKEGHIQIAYRSIMEMMSQLKVMWDNKCPDTPSGALYAGYMDMSFISVKPAVLSDLDLRVSIVYLHESHTFEVWLVARNRRIQMNIHSQLKGKELGKYNLTKLGPGIDSIIAMTLDNKPDFDQIEILIREIIEKTQKFIFDMKVLVR